jgi:hypothetical protein
MSYQQISETTQSVLDDLEGLIGRIDGLPGHVEFVPYKRFAEENFQEYAIEQANVAREALNELFQTMNVARAAQQIGFR